MVAEIRRLIKGDIQDIIKNAELSLLLLSCYSKLYLSGAQPRCCERSQREYYNQIKKDGMKKAEILEKVKERTCIPSWKGLKYCPRFGHVLPEFLTDEKAIELLKMGALTKKDFKKLPVGYEVRKFAKKKRGSKQKN